MWQVPANPCDLIFCTYLTIQKIAFTFIAPIKQSLLAFIPPLTLLEISFPIAILLDTIKPAL